MYFLCVYLCQFDPHYKTKEGTARKKERRKEGTWAEEDLTLKGARKEKNDAQ
jgi:hypothetical protein